MLHKNLRFQVQGEELSNSLNTNINSLFESAKDQIFQASPSLKVFNHPILSRPIYICDYDKKI
jgi:hypothetical protein